ncbi:MAG: ABC transporter permease [Hydrogenophilales bacterium 16-64-46]|nr:MAG: ABC transporter permease [Hydrogenophilales bacterium 12-64-13]OYZ05475.1 MAG: ABC transporter permease [Hydrogenophilales bacterium 16-64-46]OZA40055.1 MAG: ABC transporter permease [Hydrogenophilales bacterium 17-64-34]HQT00921.1 ABC transporter permease subunit [Thiobacillus sp.]
MLTVHPRLLEPDDPVERTPVDRTQADRTQAERIAAAALPGTATDTTAPASPPEPVVVAAPLPARQGLGARLLAALPGMLSAALSLGLFVAFWYFATKYKLDFYIRFNNIPSPGEVWQNAVILSDSVRFYENMAISMRRILFGFGIATVLGIALGLLIGQYRPVRALLFPVFEVLRPIPAIAWVPMAIMLWPSNETSIVFITFLGSFFPILLNTIHGVNSVDPVLVRAARCLGASESALLRQVILPASLPHIFTGLAIGMGVAWVSLIAAEMISGQYGIGYFTWEAYSLIEYADIAIGMIVIGVLGLACSGAIRLVGNALMPWLASQRGAEK